MPATKPAPSAKRLDAFTMPPEDLTVVTDPRDPLYDARAEELPNPGLVRSILKRGVRQAVIVVKRGPESCVVDGRRRVIAARQANKELTEEGLTPIRVPVVVSYEQQEIDLLGTLITLNENRQNDTALARAEKIRRYMAYGGNLEDAAIEFGKSVSHIRWHLDLLTLAPPVLRAVETGKLTATAAAPLTKLDHKVQVEKLRKLLGQERDASSNDNDGKDAASHRETRLRPRAKDVAKEVNPDRPVPPPLKEIREMLKNTKVSEEFRKGVRWARGL